MITEFKVRAGHITYDDFQLWREKNPKGYFLVLSTSRRAQLHSSSCSALSNKKIREISFGRTGCSTNPDELIEWGKSQKRKISSCDACMPNGYASLVSLSPIVIPPPAVWPFQTPIATKGIVKPSPKVPPKKLISSKSDGNVPVLDNVKITEGIARETTVITKSRSGKLKKAALTNARGMCAVCGIDYSQVLGGLGSRVLQVHHRKQLALADEPQVNGIEDLAVVCANCHQIIHSDMANAMPVEVLQKLLRNDVKK